MKIGEAVPLAISRLASMFVRPACPLCGGTPGGAPGGLCGWCGSRLYPNTGMHAGSRGPRPGGADPLGIPIHSPFLHAGSARETVILLKFHGRRDLGRLAARLMFESDLRAPGGCAVVPLPLCPSRMRERGYNQAEVIAAPLAGLLDAPLARCLSRLDRPPQIGLDAHSRRSNVKGAFGAGRDPVPVDMPVLLVDDVVTTGSTLDEAAAAITVQGGLVAGALTLTYRPEAGGDIID